MRVLTWNLWWRFGPWEDRQPAIASELETVDPDVALLQEVWADGDDDQAEILAAATGWEVQRTTRADGRAQEFGNAILSRWPLERLEQITLTGEGEPSFRSALACRVDAPTGPVTVIATHLAWQYDRSRLRQAQLAEVVDLAGRHRIEDPEAHPVVIGGDLNAVPDSEEIRRLTGMAPSYRDGLVFTDCWAAVGDGPGHTWSRQNPHARDALWPRRRLDYVLVSWPRPKPLGNPVSAQLVGMGRDGGVVPSDHYGVLVELDDRSTMEEEAR